MIRWVFKWLLRLFALCVLLVLILLLSYNNLLRVLIEHNLRAQTGMDAEIGRFKLGLTEPTIEIQDLRIYNTPGFGGTPFLKIPEIYAEYDRSALARKEIHLTLLRFNLAELDIVKNLDGQTNIFSLAKTSPEKTPAAPTAPNFKKQTGYNFDRIDALNVSITTVKYIDLQDPHNNREQKIGIENEVIPNVRSSGDLTGLILLVDLRSNHFFDPFIGRSRYSVTLLGILNLIGVTL